MQLDSAQLLLLTNLAAEAAVKAGKYIQRRAKDSLTVEHKSGGDSEASQVVTEVDRQAQSLILEVLKLSFSSYDLGLLTEESEDDNSRFVKDYFWCIDPLDGTLPFIESSPGYSVSIALVSKHGTAQLGVIYDPVKKALYRATIGYGAQKNGQPFNLESHQKSGGLTLLADRSFLKNPQFEAIRQECELLAANQNLHDLQLIGHGGAAMNAIWVIERAPAIYFKFPKKSAGGGSLWDFAASACIAKEAGAIAGDIHGEALDLNRRDSTFMNHRGILYATDKSLAEEVMAIHQKLTSQ